MSLDSMLDQAISGVIEKAVEAKPEPKAEVKVEPKAEIKSQPKEEKEAQVTEVDSDEEEEKALSFKDTVKEVKKEVKTAPRIEKIIEDGVEREVPVDELIKGYQKASVSGKRFQEASKMLKDAAAMKQEVADFVELIETNPIVALYEVLGEEKTNMTLEQYRREMAQFEQMTDAEKENFLLKRKLNADNTKRAFQFEKQQEVLSDEEAQAIKESLVTKVEKVASEYGLTTNEQRLRLLNKIKAYASHNGSPHLDTSEIEVLAEMVKEETSSELLGTIKTLKGQELLDRLGEDVVNEVRNTLLSRYKTQKAQKIETSEPDMKSKRERKEIKSFEDMKKFWDSPDSF